jgi:FHA domain
MAIHTAVRQYEGPIHPPVVDERETAPLEPTAGPARDPLARLDFRHARRAIARTQAPPGHYIGFDCEDGQRLIPIEARIIHVGRAATADLRFDDVQVSRRHAIIVRYGRHVRVLDDRSSAGTIVNGVRVIATDLGDGDVVQLGPIAFTYVVIH